MSYMHVFLLKFCRKWHAIKIIRVFLYIFSFEKLFSGHYIGDLARLTMLRLIDEEVLLTQNMREMFTTWGVITGAHVSAIERSILNPITFLVWENK